MVGVKAASLQAAGGAPCAPPGQLSTAVLFIPPNAPAPPPRQVGILVNNAGQYFDLPSRLEQLSLEFLRGHVGINSLAPTLVRRDAAAPAWQALACCPPAGTVDSAAGSPRPAAALALPAPRSSARWCYRA